MGTILNDKKTVANFARTYSARPHFYDAGDVEQFSKLLRLYDILGEKGIQFNPETLFTFHPAVDYAPLPSDQLIRVSDAYGFKRLNLTQTLIRPHIANVLSCHRLDPFLKGPGGNLGYVGNPWWATYAVYADANTQARFGEGDHYKVLGMDIKDIALPNVVATVNVLIGYDSHNQASALLTRVYGEISLPTTLRLVEYFKHKLGLKPYVHTAWADKIVDEWLQRYHGNVPCNTEKIVTPMMPCQIYGPHPYNEKEIAPIYRYPDIAAPKVYYDAAKKELFAYEEQDGYPFWGAKTGSTMMLHSAIVERPTFYGPTQWYRPLRNPVAVCVKCLRDNGKHDALEIDLRGTFGLVCAECLPTTCLFSKRYNDWIGAQDAVKCIVDEAGTIDIIDKKREYGQYAELSMNKNAVTYALRRLTTKAILAWFPPDYGMRCESKAILTSELASHYTEAGEEEKNIIGNQYLGRVVAEPIYVRVADYPRYIAWLQGYAVKAGQNLPENLQFFSNTVVGLEIEESEDSHLLYRLVLQGDLVLSIKCPILGADTLSLSMVLDFIKKYRVAFESEVNSVIGNNTIYLPLSKLEFTDEKLIKSIISQYVKSSNLRLRAYRRRKANGTLGEYQYPMPPTMKTKKKPLKKEKPGLKSVIIDELRRSTSTGRITR
jgi:hypothetical protein